MECSGRKNLGVFLGVAWRLAGRPRATAETSSAASGLLLHGSLHAVVDAIGQIDVPMARRAKQGGVAFGAAAEAVAGGLGLGIGLRFHHHPPHSRLPSGWRFTKRHPTNSGPTTSAGRQKKERGRARKCLVTDLVAVKVAQKQNLLTGATAGTPPDC